MSDTNEGSARGGRPRSTVRELASWVEPAGRIGFSAKGAIYVLVGVLAAQAAYGLGGKTTGSRGVLREIVQLPFGQILLAAVGIGLAAYALWRFVQAYMDTDGQGSGFQGLVVRAGYAFIGAIYLSLAVSAALILSGGKGGGGEHASQRWSAWLLAQPFGRWLLGAVAAVVLGVGLFQFYQAYRSKFRERLKTGEMSDAEQRWTLRLGRAGFAARGVVFCLSGALLGVAAVRIDASDAGGFDGALEKLEQQTYAPWLFGLVAVGLAAYGVFQFFLARYRRMAIRPRD